MCACMCVGAGIHSGTNACVRACVAALLLYSSRQGLSVETEFANAD